MDEQAARVQGDVAGEGVGAGACDGVQPVDVADDRLASAWSSPATVTPRSRSPTTAAATR
ncbi:hypothetical protein [Streptomyces sp. NPDC059593]|uniref:hypothetical protein n=1 Tax=Streptomyces sp. NPDC059593 TaxID=3346878 RepID=UPI0036BA75A7